MLFFNLIPSNLRLIEALIYSALNQIRGIRLQNWIFLFRGYESPPQKLIPLHLPGSTHPNCWGRSHKSGTSCCLHSWGWSPHRCFPSREIWELPKYYKCSLPRVTHEFLSHLPPKKTQPSRLFTWGNNSRFAPLSLLHGGQGEPIYPIPLHSPLMLAYLDKTGWVP